MKTPATESKPIAQPANQVNALMACAIDCITRAVDCTDVKTWDSINAAFVDQQLFRATTFLAKARAIAVTKHGVAGLVNLANDEAFHPDEVIELAPVAGVTAGKGGVQ